MKWESEWHTIKVSSHNLTGDVAFIVYGMQPRLKDSYCFLKISYLLFLKFVIEGIATNCRQHWCWTAWNGKGPYQMPSVESDKPSSLSKPEPLHKGLICAPFEKWGSLIVAYMVDWLDDSDSSVTPGIYRIVRWITLTGSRNSCQYRFYLYQPQGCWSPSFLFLLLLL